MHADSRPPLMYALHTGRAIPAEQVHALYQAAGWWPDRTVEEIAGVLDGGTAAGAWDGDLLVGFARAVSDSTFRAYIEDVVVQVNYRRQGVAGRMLDLLLRALNQVETVSLFCEPEIAGLYIGRGFRPPRAPQIVLHRGSHER